jgi:2-polyprenyl-6-methoxyphenol hydroxylase-like FAD-dependent oxidoreductase
MNRKPILIVGAGPTGLTLAIELARRDIPFHIIERRTAPLPWNRAIFIKARSLEVFAHMGLAETFINAGAIVREIALFAEEKIIASYSLNHLDSPFPFILSLPEEETERILTKKLTELGHAIERGIEFVSLTQTEHAATATLRDADGTERELEASWIVGTDGLHSPVRHAVHDEFDGHDYPQKLAVVDSRIANWSHPRELTCVQFLAPAVSPFPLGEDQWRIYCRVQTDEAAIIPDIASRIDTMSPGATLYDTDEPQIFRAHSKVARKYRVGRVLVAGDAAHVSNPLEGHGMNAGIQDAFNLGWKLALHWKGCAPDALIDSYEAERRPVAQAIVASGDESEERITNPRGGKALEELAAFLATEDGREFAAIGESETEFAYVDSPIVSEPGPAPTGTQIGCRLGDVTTLTGPDGPTSLYQLLTSPDHTALILIGDADQPALDDALTLLQSACHQYEPHLQGYVVTRSAIKPSPHTLADPKGALHKRLGAHQPTLCIIRPDGHLGFRNSPPSLDTLHTHFASKCFTAPLLS